MNGIGRWARHAAVLLLSGDPSFGSPLSRLVVRPTSSPCVVLGTATPGPGGWH